MAYNELNCVTTQGNTGKQGCYEDFGQNELIVICPASTEIATKTLAETEAKWIELFNNTKSLRGYPLFPIFNGEFESEGRVIMEGWAGKKKTLRGGTKSVTYSFIEVPLYLQKELRKHNSRTNLAFFEVSKNGYIKGWTDDGTVFKPFPLSDFYVNDMTENDGANDSMVQVSLEYDGTYWNDKGAWIKPTAFEPTLFDGVVDCKVEGTLGATGATISVYYAASASAPIVGLVSANFRLYDDSAPTVPKTVTATDNGDGTYTCTWSSITGAHTLTLFDQPIGTSGYEAINEINTTV